MIDVEIKLKFGTKLYKSAGITKYFMLFRTDYYIGENVDILFEVSLCLHAICSEDRTG